MAETKPRVFISYAHESDDFRKEVRKLAEWLRSRDIDVRTDELHENVAPEEGWIAWMQNEIDNADKVLIVCSPKYKTRFEKKEEPGTGRGATFESVNIKQLLYNKSMHNKKFYPILHDGEKSDTIPTILQDFDCNHRFPSGNERILRLILNDNTPVTSPHPQQVPPGQITGPNDTRLSPREEQFFGREKEVEAILAFLNSGRQCFHVTGTGGTGKTELCKAAFKRWLRDTNDACAFYISLPDAIGESTLMYHIGKALGAENISSFEQLRPLLEEGLYYLDNIENVASTVEGKEALKQLKACPGVRILATSRISLDTILGKQLPVYQLDDETAVQLFMSAWNAKDTPAIDEQLRRFVNGDLGGHALSVVLTARLGETYGIERIFEMWKEHGTHTIAGDEHADRTESLTRSVLFTSEALEKISGARSLWTIAALFPEGLSLDTIQEIAPDDKAALEALCKHHILIRAGDVYTMLPPIARFAIDEALAERDGFSWKETREAIYPFFITLSEKADSIASTPDALAARRRLLAQFPALHSFVSAETRSGIKNEPRISALHSCLRNQYTFRISLGIEIARLLQKLDPGNPYILKCLGDFERRTGNPDKARDYYNQCLPLYEKEQDDLGKANTLRSLGDLERLTGNPGKARNNYNQCLFLYEKVQNDLGKANTLKSLGNLELETGNPDKARDYFNQCLPLYNKELSDLGKANTLKSLGKLEVQTGNPDKARDYFNQCLPLFEKVQSDLGKANTLRLTGDLERARGNYAIALGLYSDSVPLFTKVQSKDDLACTYAGMALCNRELGNVAEMNNAAKLAYQTARASHLPPVIKYVLSVLKECGIEPPEEPGI